MKYLKALAFLLLTLATATHAQITAADLIAKTACTNKACLDSYMATLKYKLKEANGDTAFSFEPTNGLEIGEGNSIWVDLRRSKNILSFHTLEGYLFRGLKREFESLGFTTKTPYNGETGFATYTNTKYPKYTVEISAFNQNGTIQCYIIVDFSK